MELITSLTNTKVKMALSLQQKKYRDKYQLFILEGIRNAEMVIAKNISVQMCFFTQKAFTNERGKSILEQLNCPCFEVPEHSGQADDEQPQEFYKAVCYAMTDFDGNAEYISYDTDDKATQQPMPLVEGRQLDDLLGTNVTTPFEGFVDEQNEDTCVVFEHTDLPLDVGEVKKYTVLVWVEGSDSDCVDALIDAYVNFEFSFEVTDEDADIA